MSLYQASKVWAEPEVNMRSRSEGTYIISRNLSAARFGRHPASSAYGCVHVRHVGVPVTQSLMPMLLRMRFPRRNVRSMRMLVVIVVHVRMRVLHLLVLMLVA